MISTISNVMKPKMSRGTDAQGPGGDGDNQKHRRKRKESEKETKDDSSVWMFLLRSLLLKKQNTTLASLTKIRREIVCIFTFSLSFNA